MTKRQILVIFAVLCMMSLFVMTASASDGIDNEMYECAIIGIGDGSGYVTIPITVAGADNVGSVDVTLTYDASIVTVVGASNGHMDSMFSNLENVGDGEVRIGAYQTNNPGLDGEFVIAHISFKSVADSGSCPLEISVTTFKDATPVGRVLCYDVSNGTYTAASDEGGDDNDWYDDGDNGDNGNVTPTATPTTTPTTTPTASPTKNLPDDHPVDDATSNWGFLAIFVIAGILLIAYLVFRKKGDE